MKPALAEGLPVHPPRATREYKLREAGARTKQHIPGDDWHRESSPLGPRLFVHPLARSAARLSASTTGIQKTRGGHIRPPCLSPRNRLLFALLFPPRCARLFPPLVPLLPLLPSFAFRGFSFSLLAKRAIVTDATDDATPRSDAASFGEGFDLSCSTKSFARLQMFQCEWYATSLLDELSRAIPLCFLHRTSAVGPGEVPRYAKI